MEQAKAQEQSQRLASSLRKTEPKMLLGWLLKMALRRGCTLLPEDLELRRDDLLDPRSYAAQLAGRDVAIEPEDFEEAMHTLATAPRGQYEQTWPPLDAMITAVLEAAKQRRIEASKSRTLTDGRREGESDFDFNKRRYEEDRQPTPALTRRCEHGWMRSTRRWRCRPRNPHKQRRLPHHRRRLASETCDPTMRRLCDPS